MDLKQNTIKNSAEVDKLGSDISEPLP